MHASTCFASYAWYGNGFIDAVEKISIICGMPMKKTNCYASWADEEEVDMSDIFLIGIVCHIYH